MSAKELYGYALDQATVVVGQVSSEHFTLPTPCAEWNVRDLLGHMLYELAWAADIVMGKTVQEVGDAYEGDLLGDNVQRSWRCYELATRQSLKAASLRTQVHLSYGDSSLTEYLLEAGNDELIHAWDLGQAIDVEVVFDEQAAKVLYKRTLQHQTSITSSGLFAPPARVSDTASIQTKLLALLGRSENWRKG